MRFKLSNDQSDLVNSVESFRQAVTLAAAQRLDLPFWLGTLGQVLIDRHTITGEIRYIEEAIKYQRHALELTPDPKHRNRPTYLDGLGTSQRFLFERTRNPDVINEAITNQQEAVKLTVGKPPELPGRRVNLGNSLHSRFKAKQQIGDIDAAVVNLREAVNLTPDADPNLPVWHTDLGVALTSRFEHTGRLPDLEEAIKYHRMAVDRHKLPGSLNNLAVALGIHFQFAGDILVLNEAITIGLQAVELTRRDDPAMPGRLNNVGNLLQHRFTRNGDIQDIKEAIAKHGQAVELTAIGHPARVVRLSTLGLSQYLHSKWTKDSETLEEAIRTQDEAVKLTMRESQTHPDLPARLVHLGNALRTRFERRGHKDDIDKAIEVQQQGVKLTQAKPGHPDLPGRLVSLGRSLQSRHKSKSDIWDIEAAIKNFKLAVELTSKDHPALPARQMNLGHAILTRYPKGSQSRLLPAFALLQAAAEAVSAPPSDRLRAARLWAQCCRVVAPSQVPASYSIAVNLLTEFMGSEHPIMLRHETLAQASVSDLAAEAAEAALCLPLSNGVTEKFKAELALEWLEQGRCLVWSQLNELRSPIGELELAEPQLAQTFRGVSVALEAAGSRARGSVEASNSEKLSLQKELSKHVELATERQQLLKSIRQLKGFENFLVPRPASYFLDNIPRGGTIIVINAHKHRTDAIALREGEISHIPLPGFNPKLAIGLRDRYLQILQSFPSKRQPWDDSQRGLRKREAFQSLYNILQTLWDYVVRPILQQLKIQACSIFFQILRIKYSSSHRRKHPPTSLLASGGAPLDLSRSFQSTPPGNTRINTPPRRCSTMRYRHIRRV